MVLVRRFGDMDAPALAVLMTEMVGFYGATVDPGLVVADDVVRRAREVDILVAHEDGRLLGFATSSVLYPVAGLLAFTFVQQVYVGRADRRRGVAAALMAGVAAAAKAKGSSRVEWSTGKENLAARAMYDGLGAHGSDKVHYVLDGAAFERLAMSGVRGR